MEFFVEQQFSSITGSNNDKTLTATVPLSKLFDGETIFPLSKDSEMMETASSNSGPSITIENFKILYRLSRDNYIPLVQFYCDFAIDFSAVDPRYERLVDSLKREVILYIGKNIPNIVNNEMNAYAFGAEFPERQTLDDSVLMNDTPTDIAGNSKAYHKM